MIRRRSHPPGLDGAANQVRVCHRTGPGLSERPGRRRARSAGKCHEARVSSRLVLEGYPYRPRPGDAEDTVQEAWLRWSGVDHSEVRDPRAFLVRVTTRLAIDQLRRVKARRESYVGPWLPEPVLTDHDLTENAELAESVSMSMLIVLETLSALERTVFVLREAFGMPYAEIAEILGRSEPAVRQLARRAREHVRERRPRFDTDQATRRRVTERFLAATVSGDLDDLLAVLA